ncbi:hypothetical protein AB0B54_10710 [Microbispora bryophytorum]|uniref:hypothetical protein n=1 Tax=Microbispora bryophytorum TaxID=1460882 RepID=UPI0033E1C64D
MTRESMTESLPAAYERLHAYGPEFGGDEEGNHGLTNHGPMAVEVIIRRGLDIDVEGWLDRYVRRLAELPGASAAISPASGARRWARRGGCPTGPRTSGTS